MTCMDTLWPGGMIILPAILAATVLAFSAQGKILVLHAQHGQTLCGLSLMLRRYAPHTRSSNACSKTVLVSLTDTSRSSSLDEEASEVELMPPPVNSPRRIITTSVTPRRNASMGAYANWSPPESHSGGDSVAPKPSARQSSTAGSSTAWYKSMGTSTAQSGTVGSSTARYSTTGPVPQGTPKVLG